MPVGRFSPAMPHIVLANDDMCKLDGLKVSQQSLPLPEPYDKIWSSVQKVDIATFVLH